MHEKLAERISKKIPLPNQLQEHEKWCERILTGEGNILVEQKLAFRDDFAACGYFDKGVWYRGVGDVVKINGPVGLVVDWKTGKIVEDSVQLMLMAQCVFSHYPEVQAVRAEYIWLKFDANTKQIFRRAEMAAHWANVLPRVQAMKAANQSMTYPAKPGGLCRRWCAVTNCPHHGE